MDHRLRERALIVTSKGVEAVCTCGWRSGARLSRLIASVAFADHQEAASLPKGKAT